MIDNWGALAGGPVLTARLTPPRVERTVHRTSLLARLDDGVDRPLTLLAAPAGAGKTALLADWHAARASAGAGVTGWISLDREDNSRRRFWASVTAALRHAGVDDELGRLTPPPTGDLDGFVHTFLNAAARQPATSVLILDDVHVIASPAVHSDLDDLVTHAQAGLHLVLATRVDPPLRLQRLRLAGQLTELRMRDLAFDAAEAQGLLETHAVQCSDDAVSHLLDKTEGWAAGLRIAALLLDGEADLDAAAERFAGDHRAIVDYLVDEVLDGLTNDQLRLLMATSGLRRIEAPLADALLDRDDSAALLEDLLRRNVLIASIGEGSQFRCHPLLRDALGLLQRRQPAAVRLEIERRSARWFAAQSLPIAAIQHAIAGDDWDFAGDLLVEHWLPLAMAGEAGVLRRIWDEVPPELVARRPEVARAAAGLALDAGAMRQAATLLELADRAGEQDSSAGGVLTRLYLARNHSDSDGARHAARELLNGPSGASLSNPIRALVQLNLGICDFWADSDGPAARELHAAIALARAADNDHLRCSAHGWLALTLARQAQLTEAERHAEAALEVTERRGWSAGEQAAPAHTALVMCGWLRGEDHLRDARVAAARQAVDGSGHEHLRVLLAFAASRWLPPGADIAMELAALEASAPADEPTLPAWLGEARVAAEARLRLALGEHERALSLAEQLDQGDSAIGLAVAGIVRLGLGEPAGATVAAQRILDDPVAGPTAALWARVLEALALDTLGEPPLAEGAMERALDIAEPRGLRRPMIDSGLRGARILRRMIRSGTAHRAFVDELLERLELPGGATGGGSAATLPAFEPLSERELTVLRYMPTSMPYSEVAAELFVSVNTIKTHVRNVYRKLEVDSRRDAVARARELHLIGPVPATSHRAAPRAADPLVIGQRLS